LLDCYHSMSSFLANSTRVALFCDGPRGLVSNHHEEHLITHMETNLILPMELATDAGDSDNVTDDALPRLPDALAAAGPFDKGAAQAVEPNSPTTMTTPGYSTLSNEKVVPLGDESLLGRAPSPEQTCLPEWCYCGLTPESKPPAPEQLPRLIAVHRQDSPTKVEGD